jgi:selenocysteine-specific elongation factor
MHVVATAGHVDHGKSTLVRALTGMEPDRWAEERRRGMTIDLGFAWTDLPSGGTVAFVDVPGHERFVPNMLAGVGPIPVAVFVVAADEGWMPQSAEHLAALSALDVRYGLLAVTRCDLADPAPAARQALTEIGRTSLGEVTAVAVSAVAGIGLDELRTALDLVLAAVPAPDVDAPVRLWVDRAFSVRGSGTVVTGTLAAGRIRTGDGLEIVPGGRTVAVRGLQALGRPVMQVSAVARVAVNLRGVDRASVSRGTALLTPGRFLTTDAVDVRVVGDAVRSLPRTVMFHIGSAAVPARVRAFGVDTARLSLSRPLPLRIGDRGLLRDPGRHHVAGGVRILDAAPPQLTRRGAAAARARVLADLDGVPNEAGELDRRGLMRRADLERMGVVVTAEPVTGDWVVADSTWAEFRSRLPAVVDHWIRGHPLEPGPPVDVVRQALGLPDRSLVHALTRPPFEVRDGRICRGDDPAVLPGTVTRAVERLLRDLLGAPFAAPEADRLAELGLRPREIAAAVRAGALVSVGNGVVLPPGSLEEAVKLLGDLAQPFTVSEARQALHTSRRVAIPLLETLDRRGVTERLPDDRRRLRAHHSARRLSQPR